MDKSVKMEGAPEPQRTNREMNYPWYIGIPRQGIKSGSCGLPDIEMNQI